MAKHSHLPKYNEFLNPLFQALHEQMAVNSRPDRFSTIFIHHAPNAVLGYHFVHQLPGENSPKRDRLDKVDRLDKKNKQLYLVKHAKCY